MNTAFIKEVGPVKWVLRTGIRQFYKRVLKSPQQMRLPTGEIFYLPVASRFATEAFVTQGDVDWGSEKLFYDLHPQSGVFLDIGANIGYYSVYLLPKCSAIYCFEPDPRMREWLKANAMGRGQIFIVPKAVAAKSGNAAFVLETSGEVSHISDEKSDKGKNVIQVGLTTVDDFVRENNLRVDSLKIDVEGFDFDVLKGAIDTLQTQRPVVLVEAAIDFDLLRLAKDIKYKIFGYRRDIDSRAKSFVRVEGEQNQIRDAFKMLFLIPEESRSYGHAAQLADLDAGVTK